jgi:catalase
VGRESRDEGRAEANAQRSTRGNSLRSRASAISFTADDGRALAIAAGEGVAGQRGDALRPGLRPVHTLGIFASGTFTPSGDAAGEAPPHLQGSQPVSVVARFSNGNPRTDRNDRRRDARGLAVRFTLSDGATTDIVAMNTDRFLAGDREAFLAVSKALSSHWPRWRKGFRVATRQLRSPTRFATLFPPTSYVRCDYHAIHTFVWVLGADRLNVGDAPSRRPVRYRWRAQAGRSIAWPWNGWRRDRRFLEHDLERRLEGGPVGFDLEVQYGDGLDPARLCDPSRPFPAAIPWRAIGELRLDRLVAGAEAVELDRLLFSPLHLCEGIEACPGDEILEARAAAYPASHVARAEGSPRQSEALQQ